MFVIFLNFAGTSKTLGIKKKYITINATPDIRELIYEPGTSHIFKMTETTKAIQKAIKKYFDFIRQNILDTIPNTFAKQFKRKY